MKLNCLPRPDLRSAVLSSSVLVSLLICIILALVATGCRQQVPPSEYARLTLLEQPENLDRSLIDVFQIEIDGVDALADVPTVTCRTEVKVIGSLTPKPDTLAASESLWLKMAYRPLVNGQADWSVDDPDQIVRQQQPFGSGRDGAIETKLTVDERLGLGPGDYELRFFAIKENRLDDEQLPVVYHIGRGKLTVLPATSGSQEPG